MNSHGFLGKTLILCSRRTASAIKLNRRAEERQEDTVFMSKACLSQ